ncbi:MAG: hypothetical protein Q4D95_04975, partial [Peptoniphilus sp.]|nr:hypothetical protein [Peptoniphilus sp.]
MVNKSIPRRILKRNINYGFLTADKLPREEFKERNLTDRFSWSTTEEFKNMAKNHCATVCATNLALYFEVTRDNPHKIFREIYKYMGDGPKIKVEGAMKRYFRDLGYDLKLEKIRRRDEIKKSLDEGKPIILLLAGSLVNWHWVLVTGYRMYE